ncbi:MAG: tRNA pseudouridine(55) synthase TruB [Actinobacteria bacterium]|nr:tRNA pseudouridine(55) synthase TruB [Actinomycetota bacterium]
MPRHALSPSGLVLVDKPPGPSSFALVRSVRTATGARAGHAGTLDPFATGLLLVLVGAATRLARYLVGLDKRYTTIVDLQTRTATGDPEGQVVEERDPPAASELEGRLQGLRGEIDLRIPAASAVKIGGERAYRLARRGVVVEMPMRRSVVHALELLRFDGRRAELELHVSSGTYIRAIADALGGHCETLRRTAVGPFDVAAADSMRIIAPVDALAFLPAVALSAEEAVAIRCGRALARSVDPGPVRLVADGALVGVGRECAGRVRPETVLP